jgi:uncharacterized protein YwgA
MSETSWQAYGLIAHFAQCFGEQHSLGKTKLQKMVYLLEKLKNVSVGYDFTFYTYGPFSSDLAADLDYVTTLGGVQVNYEPGINMYEISPGPNADRLTEKSKDFLNENKAALDEIIQRFGTRQAKELELLATLVFVAKSGVREDSALIEKTKELKSKFPLNEIREALDLLQNWKYLG